MISRPEKKTENAEWWEAIKPCPKCGGKAYLEKEFFYGTGTMARIKCGDCGMKTNWEIGGINTGTMDLAIKRWNEIPKEQHITQKALFGENDVII